MKPQTLLAFICLILITNLSHAALGDEGGHGGDGFEAKLNHARELALEMIEAVSVDHVIGSSVNTEAQEIYSNHKDAYRAAVRKATLEISFNPLYVSEGNRVEAIAYTNDKRIVFDRELLLSRQDRDIAELILHEGGHLLGYGNDYEDALWDLANVISSLYTLAHNFPRDPFAEKKKCGTNGSLNDRILDCEIKNGAYATRRVERFTWKLVQRSDDESQLDIQTETWMDMSSGIIWGSVSLERVSKIGAVQACAYSTTLNELPTTSDINEGLEHGLLDIVPGFINAGYKYFAPFWLNDVRTVVYSNGSIRERPHDAFYYNFRCIARTH